ncbi:MAG TPA: hypothetical protein VJT49_24700 [Amycolatopsis sp.]|uniref:hypothetical protein n=1 Tax=Amycolatopsis sp. TaxID=37632 RepID=UPI002B473040|nr:hypothetical protein [Amycolatopsis sp.]HKS48250.1 hypothetical protein [Amycolatopsis sp.]
MDARAGRRDGRKRLVQAPDPGAGRVSADTPWIRALTELTRDRIAAEIQAYTAELAERNELRSRAAIPFMALVDEVNQAARLLAEAEEEPEPPRLRLVDGKHPEGFVQARRRAAAARRRTRAEQDYVERERRLAETTQDMLVRDHAVEALEEVVRLQVRRVHAHGLRRINTYWRHFVGAHPDGAAVNERCAPLDFPLPEWTLQKSFRPNYPHTCSGNTEGKP